MMTGIKKYYIGIAVIGLFTVGLFVYVLTLGNSFKNDKAVNETATNIATELNEYIRDEQEIPDELSEVYSDSIPKEITYTKESPSKYKFCVTYAGQSGPELNAQSIVYQGLSGSFAQEPYDYESDYVPSSLYISTYSWTAGEKCYDVEPRIYNRSINRNSSPGFSNFNYVCDENYEYYSLYEANCEDGVYQRSFNSGSSLSQ